MTIQAMFATGRTASYRRGSAAHRAPINPTTLIAVTLFLAVLIIEAAFLALNLPSVSDLGALAAIAGSAP
jgi:hypothetical protein